MARKARNTSTSDLLSIKQSSHIRLFRDDKDREMLLKIIKQAKDKFGFICYAYCLLDDHTFRIIMDTQGRSVSTILQSICISYAAYRQPKGKLFAGRFQSKSLLNRDELILEINSIQKRTDNSFNSYCFCIDNQPDTPILTINLDTTNVNIGIIQPTTNLEEAKTKLNTWVTENGCSYAEIMRNKKTRNRCIVELRRTTNCSLKLIGDLFSIGESTVSKILRNVEHPT